MGLAGTSLGRELRALALSHTAPVPAWHRLRSQSQSRVQTATSHNKWSAASRPAALAGRACRQTCSWTCPPCRRRVARSVNQGHLHRSSALGYASAASAVHSRVYRACTAEAAASESLGLSVGGCPRARRYFGPYPPRSITGTRVTRVREEGAKGRRPRNSPPRPAAARTYRRESGVQSAGPQSPVVSARAHTHRQISSPLYLS